MNYNDIICRFDDIHDLPISEEVLGAYFEGSLDIEDRQQIQDYINSDLFLTNLEFEMNEHHDIDSMVINTTEPVNIDSVELPNLVLNEFSSDGELFNDHDNSFQNEISYDLPDLDIEIEESDTFDDCEI